MDLESCAIVERVQGRGGGDLGGIDVEFLAPDEAGLLTLLDDALEKAAHDVESVAIPDTAETGVVRQWLIEVVAQKPPDAEPVGRMGEQLPFRAQPLEEE